MHSHHTISLTLRETLQLAFAADYVITGFVPEVDVEQGYAAYVIEPVAASR